MHLSNSNTCFSSQAMAAETNNLVVPVAIFVIANKALGLAVLFDDEGLDRCASGAHYVPAGDTGDENLFCMQEIHLTCSPGVQEPDTISRVTGFIFNLNSKIKNL